MKLKKYPTLTLSEKFKHHYDVMSLLSWIKCYKYDDWTFVLGQDTSEDKDRQYRAFAMHDEHELFGAYGESYLNALADLFRYDLIRVGVPFDEHFKPEYQYKSYDDTFVAIKMSNKEKNESRGDYKILESYLYKLCCTVSKEGFIHFDEGIDYFLYDNQLLELYQLVLQIKKDN